MQIRATSPDLPDLGGEVAQIDLTADELPESAFDFVHTRLVLKYIAQRDNVLKRLAGAVAPGGFLVIEESDVFGVLDEMRGAFGDVWVFSRARSPLAPTRRGARDLPIRLQALGLVDVDASADIPIFRGGSSLARVRNLTWVQTHEQLVQLGLSPEVTAAAQAELEDEQRWFCAPPTVRAWGRAPG